MPASEIISMLGLSAKHFWSAGERIRHVNGRELSVEQPNAKSYCSFPVETGDNADLEFVLSQQVVLMEEKSVAIKDFLRTGGELEFFIGWYFDGNSGFILDAVLLQQVAALGIALSFDIYASD